MSGAVPLLPLCLHGVDWNKSTFFLPLPNTTTFVGLENGVVGKLVLRPARNSFFFLQVSFLCALHIVSSCGAGQCFGCLLALHAHFTSLHFTTFSDLRRHFNICLPSSLLPRSLDGDRRLLHCFTIISTPSSATGPNTAILTLSYPHVSSTWHLLVQFIPRDFKTARSSLTLTGFLYINDQWSLMLMGPCTVIVFWYMNPNKMHKSQSLFNP